MKDQLLDLVRHAEWSDATIWEAALGLPQPDDRILNWMHHVHLVQHAFVRVWTGASLDLENLPKPEDHADARSIAQWGFERHKALREALAALEPGEFTRELVFPWATQLEAEWKHPLEPVTLGQSAHQVVLHSAHHRAQVSARLRDLGLDPPSIDYIRWLWRGRPEAEWP